VVCLGVQRTTRILTSKLVAFMGDDRRFARISEKLILRSQGLLV
jgi:hypothetical protein